MLNYKLFEVGSGYGFDIFKDDELYVHQEFKPGVSGFAPMSEDDAIREAFSIMIRMEG